jgi:hypothetical protein
VDPLTVDPLCPFTEVRLRTGCTTRACFGPTSQRPITTAGSPVGFEAVNPTPTTRAVVTVDGTFNGRPTYDITIQMRDPALVTGAVGFLSKRLDPRVMVPLVIGDYVSFEGIIQEDGYGLYVAAYELEVNLVSRSRCCEGGWMGRWEAVWTYQY